MSDVGTSKASRFSAGDSASHPFPPAIFFPHTMVVSCSSTQVEPILVVMPQISEL